MMGWFLILGMSTLVVVCVVIALFIHLRKHLHKTHDTSEEPLNKTTRNR